MTTTQTVVIILIVVAALAFRVYRQTREQRWSIRAMWIAPAIFLAITLVVIAGDTFQSRLAPLAALVAMAAGVWIGLYQGNHTTLRVDKPNKAVFIRVTPIGSLIFIAILALRFGVRFATMGNLTADALSKNQIPTVPPIEAVASSALLAVAVGSIIGLRLYVQRRYDAA